MKKTYLFPVTKVVKLNNTLPLLSGSVLGIGDPGSANDAEARRFGRFDFYDEEE